MNDNTHSNGNGNGNSNNHEKETNQNINTYSFYIHDIDGIQYFVDEDRNLYNTESVLSENQKPQIIGIINDADEIIINVTNKTLG